MATDGKKDFDIGAMDELITLQTFTETTDDYGYLSKTWTDSTNFTNIQAKVDQIVQSEEVTAGVQQGVEKLKFTIYYPGNFGLERFRITYSSKTFYPYSIDKIGRNRYMVISAHNVITNQL